MYLIPCKKIKFNFCIIIFRGAAWKPTVTPTGALPPVQPAAQVEAVQPVTKTSLEAPPQEFAQVGSRHNTSAKPFASTVSRTQLYILRPLLPLCPILSILLYYYFY